jgi:hypothetical protein
MITILLVWFLISIPIALLVGRFIEFGLGSSDKFFDRKTCQNKESEDGT